MGRSSNRLRRRRLHGTKEARGVFLMQPADDRVLIEKNIEAYLAAHERKELLRFVALARSTTVRARLSGACCTTPTACTKTSWPLPRLLRRCRKTRASWHFSPTV